MWTAIFGLIGVIVGALLTAWLTACWSRRNWQLQRVTEAYANMFVEGRREIALLQHIDIYHVMEPNWAGAAESSFKKLGGKIDSAFLRHQEECWFLERNENLRKRLDVIRDGYEKYRSHAILQGIQSLSEAAPKEKQDRQSHKLRELRQKEIDEYDGPNGEELLSQLDELREVLAKKYFH